jgi:hypothetical protein
MGSPVLLRISLCTCPVPSSLPRWNRWVPVALFPSNASFPCRSARSASTSHVSRPARRLLALQPAHSRSRLTTLSIEGFRRVVAFPPAPIATGWSDPCREGLAPSQEPCLSTAHVSFALSSATGLFCHRRPRIWFACAREGRPNLRELDASVGASGPHHFAVRCNISLALVIAHKSFDLPCDPIARKTLPRPPHPVPTSVRIAKRSSVWDGMAGICRDDLPDG